MKIDNPHTLSLCIFSLLLVSSKICRAADFRYEACAPQNCSGGGPNISFPFFLQSQQSYCGYPGFAIDCSTNGFPILRLSENEYIIEDIFYENRSLHVFNAALLPIPSSIDSCSRRLIRNATLPDGRFDYSGGEDIGLFFGCKNVSEELRRYGIGHCNVSRERSDEIDLAMFGGNKDWGRAIGTCEESVVARAELIGDEREDEVVDVATVLRRGFVMNWTASDCSYCSESGGRCGFNETSFHFRCFCPDGPHSRSCRPSKILLTSNVQSS